MKKINLFLAKIGVTVLVLLSSAWVFSVAAWLMTEPDTSLVGGGVVLFWVLFICFANAIRLIWKKELQRCAEFFRSL